MEKQDKNRPTTPKTSIYNNKVSILYLTKVNHKVLPELYRGTLSSFLFLFFCVKLYNVALSLLFQERLHQRVSPTQTMILQNNQEKQKRIFVRTLIQMLYQNITLFKTLTQQTIF